jgi:hypothetical protein
MKDWKVEITNELVKRAAEYKIISFEKTANELGYKHVKSRDVVDICFEVCRKLKTYSPVRLTDLRRRNASLFTELCFVEQGVEFCDMGYSESEEIPF